MEELSTQTFKLSEILIILGPIGAVILAILGFLGREWYKGLNDKIKERDDDIASMHQVVGRVERSIKNQTEAQSKFIREVKYAIVESNAKISNAVLQHKEELQKARYSVESNTHRIREALNDMAGLQNTLDSNSGQITKFNKTFDSLYSKVKDHHKLIDILIKIGNKHEETFKTIQKEIDSNRILIKKKTDSDE